MLVATAVEASGGNGVSIAPNTRRLCAAENERLALHPELEGSSPARVVRGTTSLSNSFASVALRSRHLQKRVVARACEIRLRAEQAMSEESCHFGYGYGYGYGYVYVYGCSRQCPPTTYLPQQKGAEGRRRA
ncbi:hypothetical protein TcWFU_009851 [Taenia crassiceps]|uniref:Uncharacterized protein n=1 Tax=Taenia crassiceps TaxID=6207 RepID=A0ABR4QCT3_9CEST